MQTKDKAKYIIACMLMIIAAFIVCYKTVHDLHWAYEPDFDRDIAYIRTALNGNYGQDANYTGEYMWYNPMLFLSETLVVKLTGLPVNIVVARAGAFINLLSPIAFLFMMIKLFDYRVAIAALLCFLFLAPGNLPCWGSATYSPWLVSDTFSQFMFYISIFFCYKAFAEQKAVWFAALGASLGITFLAHSAPVFIVILILVCIQGQKVIAALREKNYPAVGNYFLQGFFCVIPFIIFAFPFLYYVYGKYKLHFVNHAILECAPGIFERRNSVALIKANITFSMFIALGGLIVFYKNFENKLIRKIIFNWLIITIVMYVYESVMPTINKLYGIHLPDTIPAFHYFFYLKALQSVFFAYGFLYILEIIVKKIAIIRKTKFTTLPVNVVIGATIFYAMIYFPVYSNRSDFTELRQQAIDKGNEKDKIAVYHFIDRNLPHDKVLLCEHDLSLFPAMPTGIKMVSVETYFSNPYLSYEQREDDRNKMLSYLRGTGLADAERLFSNYKVSVVLLTNKDFEKYHKPAFADHSIIFKNGTYTILSFQLNSKSLCRSR